MPENIPRYDLYAHLHLLQECNYRCPYCFDIEMFIEADRREKSPVEKNLYDAGAAAKGLLLWRKKFLDLDIQAISKNIDKLGNKCHILLTGGEPFLFPKFVDLCKLITKKHDISMPSNLSQKEVYEFADVIDPKKVFYMICSFHPSQQHRTENLKLEFIKKVKYLESKGFRTQVRVVMYPPYFRNFDADHSLFESHGIKLVPKAFRGKFLSKSYPESYTREELELISKYDCHKQNWTFDLRGLQVDNPFNVYEENYKGRLCHAGYSFAIIYSNGQVFRCYDPVGTKSLGNLNRGNVKFFSEPLVCKSDKCSCPSFGHGFAQ